MVPQLAAEERLHHLSQHRRHADAHHAHQSNHHATEAGRTAPRRQ
jgi:hypothetical protein